MAVVEHVQNCPAFNDEDFREPISYFDISRITEIPLNVLNIGSTTCAVVLVYYHVCNLQYFYFITICNILQFAYLSIVWLCHSNLLIIPFSNMPFPGVSISQIQADLSFGHSGITGQPIIDPTRFIYRMSLYQDVHNDNASQYQSIYRAIYSQRCIFTSFYTFLLTLNSDFLYSWLSVGSSNLTWGFRFPEIGICELSKALGLYGWISDCQAGWWRPVEFRAQQSLQPLKTSLISLTSLGTPVSVSRAWLCRAEQSGGAQALGVISRSNPPSNWRVYRI